MDKEPNLRQINTLKNMVANGGKMKPAMEKAQYSKAYSKHPEKLKRTIGWKKLLKRYLPDKKLVEVALEGLDATMVKTSLTEPDRTLPDYAVRQRYLETALKMKGKLVDKTDITSGGKIIPILGGISNVCRDDSNQENQ